MHERCERHEDMSPDGKLIVMLQDDGDVIIAIQPSETDNHYLKSVEFCAVGAGGGRSPNTRKALADLFHAIRKDNEDHPIGD